MMIAGMLGRADDRQPALDLAHLGGRDLVAATHRNADRGATSFAEERDGRAPCAFARGSVGPPGSANFFGSTPPGFFAGRESLVTKSELTETVRLVERKM